MEITREMDFEKVLEEEKNTVGPMIRFEPIDKIAGGFRGRLVVLGGYTGSYKTTFALNIAYNNTVQLGYTTALLSLEMSPSDLWKKLLVRHAQHPKFSKYKMNITLLDGKKSGISPGQLEERSDFLKYIVAPDLKNNREYGHIAILTAEDFIKANYGVPTLLDTVQKRLDDLGVNFGIDLFIVDYLQLFAGSFRPSGTDKYQFSGDVIRYFKNLTQTYKFDTGEGINVIALSQISREGFRKAKERGGVYDLTCLAESTELESAADMVITLFVDAEERKANKCKVQLLKNRSGEPILDPIEMLALPEMAYMGDYRQSTIEEMHEIVNSLLGVGILPGPRDFHLDAKG